MDSAEQSMQQISAPLPVDAVGVGARWANLESLESTGTGTMMIEFARLVPRSEISLAMAMAMSVALQGQTMQIGMDVQMDTSMTPAGAVE